MISLEQANRTDRLMRATTSLTGAEFEALAGRLEGSGRRTVPSRRLAASQASESVLSIRKIDGELISLRNATSAQVKVFTNDGAARAIARSTQHKM